MLPIQGQNPIKRQGKKRLRPFATWSEQARGSMPGFLERAPLDLIAPHLLVESQDDIGARQRASANTCAALSLTFISSALLLSEGARAQTTPPTLPPIEVVGTTPLIGTGLDRNLVPAQTTVLNQQDLRREGMPQLVRSLEREVGSVSSMSASGNPFQPTLFYRGFAASPLQGTPQGLAVYLNGMRFNQPFGDTVYWDLIPDVAIELGEPLWLQSRLRPQCARWIDQRQAEERLHLPGRRSRRRRRFVRPYPGRLPVRTSQRKRCDVYGGQRAAPERLARPADVRHLQRIRRHRLAWLECRAPLQRDRRPVIAERTRHRARPAARRGTQGAIHVAQPDRQYLCGSKPVGQRRLERYAFNTGAGLLPLLSAKGGQWQCDGHRAVPERRQRYAYAGPWPRT